MGLQTVSFGEGRSACSQSLASGIHDEIIEGSNVKRSPAANLAHLRPPRELLYVCP